MKKSVVSLLLCIVMIVALTACDAKEAGSTASVDNAPTAGTTVPAATTAPTTETTDVAEEQPEATDAPEVTKAPRELKMRNYPHVNEASLEKGDVTFFMEDLSWVKSPRTDYVLQEDGSLALRFKQQYAEIRLLLPRRVDLSKCSGITVKMQADYDVDITLFDDKLVKFRDWGPIYTEYGCRGKNMKEFYFVPDVEGEVCGIGFIAGITVRDFAHYKAVVQSITFHSNVAGADEENSEVTETDEPTQGAQSTVSKTPTPMPVALAGKKLIAITVDDGTDGEGTGDYIALAKKYNIPLTFFVVGNWSVNHPRQLQEILDAGCEIGNHSANHVHLTELSEAEIKKEIEGAKKTVRKYAPDAQMNFVRAPYLAYNDTVLDAVEYPLIDAILHESDNDYKESLNMILNAEDGDIMMLHTWNKLSLQALEEAIPQMEKKGFAFVTVSQLFEAQGVEPRAGTIYQNVKKNVFYSKEDVNIPKEIAPDVTKDMTLRNTYGTVLGYVGTCASLQELRNPAIVQEIKKEYNSITSGNEGKLDAIMANPAMLITVEEARKLGYVIPENYKEAVVPKLSFRALDEILEICAENDLMYRFHTLLWHMQSLEWFYRSGYKNNGEFVSPEVMDARIEFYIRTVMEHVYSGEYGHIVYAWDVMNEHLHANMESSSLVKVYGDCKLEPEFLKHAYGVADDVLRKYGIRDKVALVFNEYDTYLTINGRSMAQDILTVVDYINSDGMICDTIGMQSHMDTDVPIAGKQKQAIQAFLDAGYGVQFTEAEVNIKEPETGKADQETYYCEFMKTLLEIAKDGGKITGLTFWGTGDDVSWLKEYTPLMFTHLGRPKDIYYKVLQMYMKPESVVIKEPVEISYDFSELKYLDSYGTNYTINKDGSVDIGFENQYQEIKFLVPEAIDMEQCIAVTVRAKSEYSDVSVKLYDEEVKNNTFCRELFIHWGCLGEGILDYEMYPNVEGGLVGIGFMSLQNVEDFSKYKATVYGVTFHMEPGYKK